MFNRKAVVHGMDCCLYKNSGYYRRVFGTETLISIIIFCWSFCNNKNASNSSYTRLISLFGPFVILRLIYYLLQNERDQIFSSIGIAFMVRINIQRFH